MVNPVGRMISEAKCAYIAGLIDADGAIMASIEKHNEKKYGFRVRVTIMLTQKNTKVLRWVQSTLSCGRIVANRTTNDWILRNQEEIYLVIRKIDRYLIGKQMQAEIAMEILRFKINSRDDLLKVAQLADTLASFNVRSKNRRKNFASKIKETIPRND